MFSQFEKRMDVSRPHLRRIHNFQVVREFDILASCDRLNFCRVTQEHAACDSTPRADAGCLNGARFNSFGQNDSFFCRACFFGELVKKCSRRESEFKVLFGLGD